MILMVLAIVGVSRADHIEGTSCGNSASCAGHEYWPRMTQDDVQKTRPTGKNTLRGKQNNDDELLGWHGSDTLYGGDGDDVLWGDHVGDNQPTNQWDRIYGDEGGDFIYSSHGRNTIRAGAGNDAIKARYGKGVVDCGPGIDIVYIPRSRKSRWTFRSCERFEYRSERARGHGIRRAGD
jgi:hypothetical protein